MRTLGISAYPKYCAVCVVEDSKIVLAERESDLTNTVGSVPVSAVAKAKKLYRTFDHIFITGPAAKLAKQELKLKHSKILDYKTALTLSGLVTSKSTNTAVLLSDEYHTALGTFCDGELVWRKELHYPNSLGLFYSAGARFVGLPGLKNELGLETAYYLAKPTFSGIIKNCIFAPDSTEGYKSYVNLERGFGYGPSSSEVAASVQDVFNSCIRSLARQIRKFYSGDDLVFVGKSAHNTIANTILSEYFDNIYIQPALAPEGAAIGAASLYDRPVYETPLIHNGQYQHMAPSQISSSLLAGNAYRVVPNAKPFSAYKLGLQSDIAIPFDTHMESLNKFGRDYYFMGQQKDVDQYVVGKVSNYVQFRADFNSKISYKIKERPRIVSVNPSTNPIINRVLEETRQAGYPFLVVTDV